MGSNVIISTLFSSLNSLEEEFHNALSSLFLLWLKGKLLTEHADPALVACLTPVNASPYCCNPH